MRARLELFAILTPQFRSRSRSCATSAPIPNSHELVELMWRWHSVTPHAVAALRGGHNLSRHGVSGPH
jgi:hypothetical protein